MRRFWQVLVLAVLVPGCATASSEDRRAYILAHPHGWVEITISDPHIPDVPPAEDSNDPWQPPSSCGVSVELNDEPVLYEAAYASGESAPYSATTGFSVRGRSIRRCIATILWPRRPMTVVAVRVRRDRERHGQAQKSLEQSPASPSLARSFHSPPSGRRIRESFNRHTVVGSRRVALGQIHQLSTAQAD